MKIMEKISEFFGRYMAAIVLALTALALFVPSSCVWIPTTCITYFLMIVMFCMGLTMKPHDFVVVFTRPRDVIIGCIAQFTIMPLLAFGLGKLFGLEAALLVGVILVGTCPGGTSSNVITYLSGGDVPLSVGMTAVNTLLAPLVTPAITYLLLRTTISVDMLSMFLSIVQVVIVPIALGFVVNHFFGRFIDKFVKVLPMISVIGICLIVVTVVSHNAARILSTGAIIFAVVILHNMLGYACGYGIARLLKFPIAKKKALSVEIGMQNSGLATSLAGTSFPNLAMATVPGAIFSVWHNISGALLAAFYRRLK